jgi:hypothetical protein
MATYPLTWLAEVLRAAGCKVIEEDGWKTRGRDGSFTPKAIMLHHDASPAGETSNGVDVIRDGRPGLAGPLSQLWLAYDGTWHVVAAGRANHAGEGGPWGVISADDGNGDAIGIETDHTTDEKWTDPQRSEGLRGVHAIAQRLGITTRAEIDRAITAHKEYAPDRKVDPDPMDMDNARAQLAAYDGSPDDDGAPVKKIQKATSKPREIVDTEWRKLCFSDKDEDPTGVWAVVQGPAGWFDLTVQAVIEGDVGSQVLLRPYRDDPDQQPYPIRSYTIPPGGTLHAELTQQGSIADSTWLRVEGKVAAVTPGQAVITSDKAQVATW